MAFPAIVGLSGCLSFTDDSGERQDAPDPATSVPDATTTERNSGTRETEASGRAQVEAELVAPDSYPKGGPGVVNVRFRAESQTEFSCRVLLGEETLEMVSGQIEPGNSYDETYHVEFGQEDSVELRVEDDASVVEESSKTITLVKPRHEWAEYGANPTNTFRNSRTWGPTQAVTQQWALQEATYGQPVVLENKLYICSPHEQSRLVCLSLDTGDKLWEVETDDVFEGAVISDGLIYLTEINSGGKTRAITTDGNEVWAFEHDTHSNTQRSRGQDALTYHVPVVQNDKLFIHSPEAGVFALDKRDGTVVWNTEGVTSICSLSADSERVYGAGPIGENKSPASGGEQWIWSLRQDTGDVVWTTRTDVTAEPNRYVGPEDEQYAPEFRFTPPTIDETWVHIGTSHRMKLRGREGGPIDDGRNNHLFRIDKQTGDIAYEIEISDFVYPPAPLTTRVGVSAPLTVYDEMFVLCKPSLSDRWYWVGPEGQKLDFGSAVLSSAGLSVPRNTPPVVTANGVYFLTLDNNLARIDATLEGEELFEDVGDFEGDILEADRGLCVVDSRVVSSGSGGIRVYTPDTA